MAQGDDLKRIKRVSRKQVPRRKEREIPLRGKDPKRLRYSAKEDILRALEEEDEDLLQEGLFAEEPTEDSENDSGR